MTPHPPGPVPAPGWEPAPELDLATLLERNPQLRLPHDEYTARVTAGHGERLPAAEAEAELAAFPGAGRPAHLYAHLPLCNYICHFCSYAKRMVPRGREAGATRMWQDLLIEESRRYLDRFDWLPRARIESFYLGGGTAALLLNDRETIAPLMAHVREEYALADDAELTIEGNPANFRRPHLRLARELGFNRFSLGVQSLQDEVNAYAKRRHSAADALEAIDNLLATGCPFNVDMMFGLPYQTPDSVRHDITVLTKTDVPTITLYRLRNSGRQEADLGNRAVWSHPKVLARLIDEGRFPTLEMTYAMRQAAVEVLLEQGYDPTPCGSWSRPGTYPDGNIPRTPKNKWERYDTMIAYGPGAYGWLTGGRDEVVQTHNVADLAGYVTRMQTGPGLPLSHGRRLTGHQAVGTALGFSFKANQPIELDRYREQFGADLLTMEPYAAAFDDLLRRGLVGTVRDGKALKPTLDGEALHEEIIEHYFHHRIGLSDAPVSRR